MADFDARHSIPSAPPLIATEADERRVRASAAKTLPRTNRAWWKCGVCGKSGKGAGNEARHKRTHGERVAA